MRLVFAILGFFLKIDNTLTFFSDIGRGVDHCIRGSHCNMFIQVRQNDPICTFSEIITHNFPHTYDNII